MYNIAKAALNAYIKKSQTKDPIILLEALQK